MPGVNPDLQKERDTATIDVKRLTHIIDGGIEVTQRRRKIQSEALKEPIFTEGEDYHFLSREQQYEKAVQKGVHMWQWAGERGYTSRTDLQFLIGIAFPSESMPNSLHWVMFIPTLESQASEEQKAKWLPRCYSGELQGTYAQTELGHGTNLRKLETTATYDPRTEEFVIHCPTLTAMKWWPGSLGKTANCCVLMAQLVTQGRNHGMHPFFVQFRRSEDHQPLPGVTVGDIGPKFGYHTIDNGFLKFDNFRIPRENLLQKHFKVLKDGTYVSTTTQKKPVYSVLTLTRAFIIWRNTAMGLGAGLTIAIRYSAVRRQSELKPGQPEPQILEYQTQQYKLFPYLAMSYGFLVTSRKVIALYDKSTANPDNAQLSAENHALSSGLKAFCTAWMNLGLEQCRFACGGHGYSQASGLPKLYVVHTPALTFEGENTVLLLQAARYLLKWHQQLQSGYRGSVPDSVSHLAGAIQSRSTLDRSLNLAAIVDSFQHRARYVLDRAANRVQRLRAGGMEDWQARNESGVELVRAVQAHCEYIVIRSFVDAVSSIGDTAIAKVMKQLCQLLAAYWISNQSGDFMEDGYLSYLQVGEVKEIEVSLLADIRPNAVALVDAFDFTDHYLCSALGRYDGQVYQALYDWAQKSPLNKTQVHESYYKYLKPMMQAGSKL